MRIYPFQNSIFAAAALKHPLRLLRFSAFSHENDIKARKPSHRFGFSLIKLMKLLPAFSFGESEIFYLPLGISFFSNSNKASNRVELRWNEIIVSINFHRNPLEKYLLALIRHHSGRKQKACLCFYRSRKLHIFVCVLYFYHHVGCF